MRTIYKAQEQTLKVSGVHLEQNRFSHGQLYVAYSRVSCPRILRVFAQDGETKTVVNKNVLTYDIAVIFHSLVQLFLSTFITQM